jgi:hypothetical protein
MDSFMAQACPDGRVLQAEKMGVFNDSDTPVRRAGFSIQ